MFKIILTLLVALNVGNLYAQRDAFYLPSDEYREVNTLFENNSDTRSFMKNMRYTYGYNTTT